MGSNVLLLISRPPLPGEDALSHLIDGCPDVLMLPPLSREASRELLDRLLEPRSRCPIPSRAFSAPGSTA